MSRLIRIALLSTALLVPAGVLLHAQERDGAAEKSESMPEPSPIWRWANFVLLAGGLGYLLAKTLPPLFKSRTAEIQQGIAEAQKIKGDADRRAAEVEARLRTLSNEIEQFRTHSRAEMQREQQRISEETKVQMAKLEQQAAQEIEAATKTARRELKEHAASLALKLAEERLRAGMSAGSADGLVDGFIRELGSKTAGKEMRN